MARPKKPAHLRTGHHATKEQIEEMSKLEAEICSEDDIVNIVPDYLNEYAKVYYRYLIDNLRESGITICNLDLDFEINFNEGFSSYFREQ